MLSMALVARSAADEAALNRACEVGVDEVAKADSDIFFRCGFVPHGSRATVASRTYLLDPDTNTGPSSRISFHHTHNESTKPFEVRVRVREPNTSLRLAGSNDLEAPV